MTELAFFDTNILLYMFDLSALEKRSIAGEVFQRHIREGRGVLSTQVLQEFYVGVTGKVAGLPVSRAKALVADYMQFNVVVVHPAHILNAIDIQTRFRLSFWDGLILAAAKSAGATILFSEDLSHGQVYDGVRVQNPFRALLN